MINNNSPDMKLDVYISEFKLGIIMTTQQHLQEVQFQDWNDQRKNACFESGITIIGLPWNTKDFTSLDRIIERIKGLIDD